MFPALFRRFAARMRRNRVAAMYDRMPSQPMPPIPAGAPPVPELNEESLDRWIAAIRPTPGEWAWRAIPWRPTLWQAAVDARRERKPIALLVMNGHPLGAT